MSYPDEAKIKANIEEIAKYGYCRIDGVTIYETQVTESMSTDAKAPLVLNRLLNGLSDMALELNRELYEKHARSMVVDALASVEGEANE